MTQISVGTLSKPLLFISLTCARILSVANAQSLLPDSLYQKEGIEFRSTKLVIAGEEKALPAQPIITLTIVSDGLVGGTRRTTPISVVSQWTTPAMFNGASLALPSP